MQLDGKNLPFMMRMNRKWEYALLGEDTFYGLKNNGADTKEILKYILVTESKKKGTLF